MTPNAELCFCFCCWFGRRLWSDGSSGGGAMAQRPSIRTAACPRPPGRASSSRRTSCARSSANAACAAASCVCCCRCSSACSASGRSGMGGGAGRRQGGCITFGRWPFVRPRPNRQLLAVEGWGRAVSRERGFPPTPAPAVLMERFQTRLD